MSLVYIYKPSSGNGDHHSHINNTNNSIKNPSKSRKRKSFQSTTTSITTTTNSSNNNKNPTTTTTLIIGIIGIQLEGINTYGTPYRHDASTQEYHLYGNSKSLSSASSVSAAAPSIPNTIQLQFHSGKIISLNQLQILQENQVHLVRVDSVMGSTSSQHHNNNNNGKRQLHISDKIQLFGNYWRRTDASVPLRNAAGAASGINGATGIGGGALDTYPLAFENREHHVTMRRQRRSVNGAGDSLESLNHYSGSTTGKQQQSTNKAMTNYQQQQQQSAQHDNDTITATTAKTAAYKNIMHSLLNQQRIGRIPFVTLSQHLIAREKATEIGADLLRGQYGVAYGQWVSKDATLDGRCYLLLHRFQPVDVTISISNGRQQQQQQNDNNNNNGICSVVMEIDASDFSADVYHLEASLVRHVSGSGSASGANGNSNDSNAGNENATTIHQHQHQQPLCKKQMFNLTRGIRNQFKLQFKVPATETYSTIKDATLILTNMHSFDPTDEELRHMNHPAAYTYHHPFIVSIYAERFSIYSRRLKRSSLS